MGAKRIARFDVDDTARTPVSVLPTSRSVALAVTDRSPFPALVDGWVSYDPAGVEHPIAAGSVWTFSNWHDQPNDPGVVLTVYVRTQAGLGYCYISQD